MHKSRSLPANSHLKRYAVLFPLSLVLYEFSTYICNDMIQPGMLSVVAQFNVNEQWVSTSMTAYMAGGMFLQWLLGPLSDRLGRRPVMLCGVVYFIIMCLSILWARSIEAFIAIRFLQGISLCFIGAVGYAAVQEAFEESVCIKITALMANVALIAPLLGPLAGVALIAIAPWQSMFIIFALLAAIAYVGLWRSMPETAPCRGGTFSLRELWRDYQQVFTHRSFLYGALALGFASVPLLVWIAQSPVILISHEKLSHYDYGLLQIPIFSALIVGNLVLAKLISKRPVRILIHLGAWPLVAGLLLALLCTAFFGHAYLWIVVGLSFYSFGLGVVNACLYRLTLFSCTMSKGTVSAAIGMITMAIYTLGIEVAKIAYFVGEANLFNLVNAGCGLCWLILTVSFMRRQVQ